MDNAIPKFMQQLNPLGDHMPDEDMLPEAIRAYIAFQYRQGTVIDYSWLCGFAHALCFNCFLTMPELAKLARSNPEFAREHFDMHLKQVTDAYEIIVQE